MRTLIVPLALFALGGCLSPGTETRKAYQQDSWTILDEVGADMSSSGTQEEEVLYGEGAIVMTTDEEGNEVIDFENSAFTKIYHKRPSTDNLTAGFAGAMEARARSDEQMWGTIGAALQRLMIPGIMGPALPPANPVPAPVPQPAGSGPDSG